MLNYQRVATKSASNIWVPEISALRPHSPLRFRADSAMCQGQTARRKDASSSKDGSYATGCISMHDGMI